MKKVLSIVLCLTFIFSFAACSGSNSSEPANSDTQGQEEASSADTIKTVLDPSEYVLYQNIFYNEQGDDYVGKTVTKSGVFTKIYDEYNSTVRYYVWGYNDKTKCCDWQWEIVPTDTSDLPNLGATVEATGIFAASDSSLDGYWIENATLKVTHDYTASTADIDMTTMGGTLERVQVLNMQQFAEKFEGKSVAAYGRIETPITLQHPYYDNCFSQQFTSSDPVQAIGTLVIVTGKYVSGTISDASVAVTTKF